MNINLLKLNMKKSILRTLLESNQRGKLLEKT